MIKIKAVGIDVGTTNIKVVIYDVVCRNILAKHIEKTPVIVDEFGGYSYNPSVIKELVFELLKKAINELDDKSELVAISSASFGETIVLLDDKHQPVGNSIAWYDNRGKSEAKEFLTEETISMFKGNKADDIFSLFKILWMQKYTPKDIGRTKLLIDMGGYILGCLCNNYVMDWSHASRTGLFDIYTRTWNQYILNKASINEQLLPPLMPSGTVIGNISKEIALLLDIHTDVSVVTGGHDHLCAAYASGIRKPGELFISAGTSEAHLTLTERPLHNNDSEYQIDQGCFIDDKHYYIMSSIPSGHVYKHWRELLFFNTCENEIYDAINKIPIGSSGVKFQLSDDLKNAQLSGLSFDTNRETIMRAIFESLALKSNEINRVFSDILGLEFSEAIISGHPTKKEVWKNIRSAILNKDLVTIIETESTSLGAAFLAIKPFVDNINEHIIERTRWAKTTALCEKYANILLNR